MVVSIVDKFKGNELKQSGHVKRDESIRVVMKMVVEGKRKRGRLRKIQEYGMENNMIEDS